MRSISAGVLQFDVLRLADPQWRQGLFLRHGRCDRPGDRRQWWTFLGSGLDDAAVEPIVGFNPGTGVTFLHFSKAGIDLFAQVGIDTSGIGQIVNTPPTAVPDTGSVAEDTAVPITGNVLANDSDPDVGAVLSVSAVNGTGANVGATVSG